MIGNTGNAESLEAIFWRFTSEISLLVSKVWPVALMPCHSKRLEQKEATKRTDSKVFSDNKRVQNRQSKKKSRNREIEIEIQPKETGKQKESEMNHPLPSSTGEVGLRAGSRSQGQAKTKGPMCA